LTGYTTIDSNGFKINLSADMVTLMAKRINEKDAAGPNNPTYRERFAV